MEDTQAEQNMKNQTGNTVIILLAVIVLASIAMLLHTYGSQMVDDGYYYLEIARNISSGNGFTFDGINPTNGFHPLWQILLVPLSWLFSGGSAFVYASTIMQTLSFTGSGFILFRLLFSLTGRLCVSTGAAAFWLLNFLFWSKGALSGMETGILLFFFAASLIIFMRVLRGTSSPWTLSAVLLAACTARLDTLALVAGTALVFLFLKEYRKAVITGLPLFVYLPVYMIINRIWFGGYFPVSGYIKSSTGRELLGKLFSSGDISFFQHALRNLLQLATLGGRIPLPLLAVTAAGFVWLIFHFWKKMSDSTGKSVLAAVFVYITGVIGYYSFMYESLTEIYTYYWFPAIFGIVVVFSLFLSQIERTSIRHSVLGIIFAGLVFFNIMYARDRLRSYSFVIPDSDRVERMGVEYLNTCLDDGTVIGCWDAGYVGYYCRHRVVNLDGLVNSFEYQEILKNQGLKRYIETENITCIANVDYFSGQREFIESLGGWNIIFEDSTGFPAAVSIFSISDSGRDYASRQSRIFYIYGKTD